MAKMEYSLIIEGFKAAGDMGAANGPPKQPGNGGPSAPSEDSGGGGGGASDKKLAGMAEKGIKLQEKQPSFMGKMVKKMGINVGISSILKQSQIFTGTIGSIFQIFGALVDVILAPFLPIIVPIIRLLGNLIPMIHKSIRAIIDWYDANIGAKLTDFGKNVGGWISDHLLGWLPDSIQTKVKDFFENMDWGKWVKNLALGAIFLLMLKTFGFGKILAPLASLLAKIPVIGPILKSLGGMGAGIAAKIAGALGLSKLFPKLGAGGAVKTTETTAKAATAAAKKGGGWASKLSGGIKKLGPKSLMAAAKTAGPMGILKGVAKKAIPGLSSALLMYQGVKGAIDVFKSNQEAGAGFWKSIGKASAVAGTAAVGAGLSFVPGMGLIAPIAGGMAVSAMTNAMMAKPPEGSEGGDIVVKVQVGETEVVSAQITKDRELNQRATQAQDQASVSLG